jgi:hypothetical protein
LCFTGVGADEVVEVSPFAVAWGAVLESSILGPAFPERVKTMARVVRAVRIAPMEEWNQAPARLVFSEEEGRELFRKKFPDAEFGAWVKIFGDDSPESEKWEEMPAFRSREHGGRLVGYMSKHTYPDPAPTVHIS